MARTDVKVTSERNPSKRDPDDRAQPFFSVLLMGLVVVPVFGGVLRFIIFCAPEVRGLIGWCCIMLGVAIGGFAIAYNLRIAKRDWLVAWHVTATAMAFGTASYVTINVRWPAQTEPWYIRLLAVVNWPSWWVVVHLFGSIVVAVTWLLYRLDNFRANSSTGSEDGQSKLEKLVRWPVGARLREDSIEADESGAVTAVIDHEGIPVAQIRGSMAALEEHPAFVRNRGTVIAGDRGGSSRVRLLREDPHTHWRTWPGLSHPGGFFHEPLRTCYYSTGEVQWYSFVRTPDGYRSRLAPDFASPNGTFIGAQGMTGAGKSGEAANEIAEVASRRDVVNVYIDPATLMATCGWCLDFADLAADSPATSGALFAGLRKVGEYRQKVLGAIGARDFTPEVARKTGLSWVYIFADEFDISKQGANMTWLATKARKLGFRFKFTLPRATGDNLDTNIRAAVGAWRQFGITQDYDSGFVISAETMEAGANPESFGASTPGVNYFDRAPGIDSKMYPIDCRAYKSREDFSDLRADVLAARATFEPARFTPAEIEALGDVARICSPAAIKAASDSQLATMGNETESDRQPDMQKTMELPNSDETREILAKYEEDDDMLAMDPETRALLDDIHTEDVSELEREFGDLDPRKMLPAAPPDTFEVPEAKPTVGSEEGIRELKAALIRLARRTPRINEFDSEMLRDEMTVRWSGNRMSEFLSRLDVDEDGSISPPGLKIARLSAGHYAFIRLDEH